MYKFGAGQKNCGCKCTHCTHKFGAIENIFSSTFSHRKSNNTTLLWYAKHVVCFKQKRWVINTSSIATGIFFYTKQNNEWKLCFSFTNYTAVDEIYFFTWITVYWKKITFILFFKNLTWKVDFPRHTDPFLHANKLFLVKISV